MWLAAISQQSPDPSLNPWAVQEILKFFPPPSPTRKLTLFGLELLITFVRKTVRRFWGGMEGKRGGGWKNRKGEWE